MRVFSAIATLLLTALPLPVLAAQCGPRPAMVAALTERYEEAPIWRGLTNDGSAVIELWTAEGTFTVLATNTSGISCIISAGAGWDYVSAREGDPA